MKGVDSAFRHGVGVQAGLEVWQIEDSRLKVLQKGEHGKFISDQSYIILQTRLLLNGALQHSIHCWCGPQTSQNDVERAAIKAVELNASLGNRAVITCEKAGYESDRFLSYFKPCFIPIQRKTNQHPTSETSKYQNRIFLYKGRHVARITEVPFSRSSLSHDGIFLVDTRHKVFQFNGANTDPYERAKALDAVQYLMDNLHKEKCPIAVIDDGKLVADIDSGEFWALFGGYAPLIKKMGNGSHGTSQSSCELHVVHDGQINETQAAPLRKEMLKGNRTCILDCDKEVFAWMGHRTSLEDRKIAFVLAERLCSKKRNPHENKLFCVNEDFEPVEFQMKFDVWPLSKKSAFSESGREKVAVLLKQRGFNVKGLLKPAPVVEKLQLISNTGNLQVWCLERGFKECLQTSELVKLKSGNCYTILHSFSANQKEEHFVYTWIGDQSSTETRASATSHAKEIANSFQGRAVEVQIFQGKEPSYFYSLFSKLIITEDMATDGKGSIFQIYQSGPSKWRAVQVNMVAALLNSSSCFFLQAGENIFVWYGKFTSQEEQEATKNLIYQLRPNARLNVLKEGAEPHSFWSLLGGKQVYQSHHEPAESLRTPRLFSCTKDKENLKTTEVFNFTQEDLFSDEIMIVDCFSSIFVWVGEIASTPNKLRALEIGQMYLDMMSKFEGNSIKAPIHVIQEGSEPLIFTSLFNWDSAKIKQHRNVFEEKLSALKGEVVRPREVFKANRIPNLSSAKSFQITPDKVNSNQKVIPKAENPLNKFHYPKNKGIHSHAPDRSVSALPNMFEVQKGREAPPNTPIVKLSTLSLKPKVPLRESPTPTPSSRTTPKSAISPAIASLTCVYESYNDRFAFAWPGMKLRHDTRALSRDVDTFDDLDTLEVYGEQLNEETNQFIAEAREEMDAEDRDSEEQRYYPYERLKVSSSNPVPNINRSKRETYLSNEEFQEVFLMDKETFYKLPKWKQDKYKMLLDLF